jgi:hypothetical protein
MGEFKMINDNKQTEAGQHYAAAYEIHYGAENFREAFKLYREILTRFPDTREAGYALSQITHIVNATVSKEERINSQLSLADAAFEKQPV